MQWYESSVIMMAPQKTDTAAFVQFVFNNADFNVNTLDGHNTFHSLCGIQCITPARSADAEIAVPRVINPPSAEYVQKRLGFKRSRSKTLLKENH